MQLIIKTNLVTINNYKPLNDKFDEYIIKLYEKYFLNPYQTVEILLNKYPNEFDIQLMDYFNRIRKSEQQDDAFNAFTPIFNSYIKIGLLDEAQNLWKRILEPVHSWQEINKRRIHKGSIYYFWAQPAILKGDIDTGFFLIHQASEEDKLTNRETYTSSPAFKTATLNYLDTGQFLYSFVIKWRDFLNQFITVYNHKFNNNLSLEEFNKKFLTFLPVSEAVYSFSHVLAKISKLADTPPVIIENNYASVYELNLIFDLILVIDSVIYLKNPADWKYIVHANNLLSSSGVNSNTVKNYLYLKESLDKMENDPNNAIDSLLDIKMYFSDGYTPSIMECNIYLSYCLRNYSAHNLNAIPSIWKRFWEIQQSIMNVLFLTIETFYEL